MCAHILVLIIAMSLFDSMLIVSSDISDTKAVANPQCDSLTHLSVLSLRLYSSFGYSFQNKNRTKMTVKSMNCDAIWLSTAART